MGDVAELEELHELLTEERGKLDDNLSNAREVVHSEIGWQYSVMGEYEDSDGQQFHWTFKNQPDRIYAPPTVGAYMTLKDGSPAYFYQSRFTVLWYQRSDQEGVAEAKADIEKAIEDGGSLSMMNEDDLNALIEVPKTLARSREVLKEAKDTFETRKSEGEGLYGAGGTWTGSGYQAYVNALDMYLGRFDTMITDIDNLMEAHVPLVDRIIDLGHAILQVYIDAVDGSVKFVKEAINLTKGPLSWQSGAAMVADLLGQAATEHHKEVQKKLKEIKESFEFQAMVELASNIVHKDWPVPEGISNDWN